MAGCQTREENAADLAYEEAEMTNKLRMFLAHIDWVMLVKQKSVLIEVVNEAETDEERDAFLGLINLLDALQDAGAEEGFPVWRD